MESYLSVLFAATAFIPILAIIIGGMFFGNFRTRVVARRLGLKYKGGYAIRGSRLYRGYYLHNCYGRLYLGAVIALSRTQDGDRCGPGDIVAYCPTCEVVAKVIVKKPQGGEVGDKKRQVALCREARRLGIKSRYEKVGH